MDFGEIYGTEPPKGTTNGRSGKGTESECRPLLEVPLLHRRCFWVSPAHCAIKLPIGGAAIGGLPILEAFGFRGKQF